jgi:winged helix DNA-binding protein
MSTARFDELIHAPTRLAIVALLAAAQWADFKYIRDELGLSDSALSKQLSTHPDATPRWLALQITRESRLPALVWLAREAVRSDVSPDWLPAWTTWLRSWRASFPVALSQASAW